MTQPIIYPFEDRTLLSVTGTDAFHFLQNLISQDLEGLEEGEARFATLLTPQGKILSEFFVITQPQGYLLDCNTSFADGLVKRLRLYKLRAKVDIEECDDLKVAALFGPGDAAQTHPSGALAAFADPRLAALGARLIVSSEAIAAVCARYHQAAPGAYNNMRIYQGVPEMGPDFGPESVFLTDVNYDLLNAVSYQKGCFVGQEVTSRMKRKTDIRKRTLIAVFKADGPAPGDRILANDTVIGGLMSAVPGGALALARLDRLQTALEDALPLTAEETPVVIEYPDYLLTEKA